MISLGCAKNLVDAEIMLGGVLERGMEITSNADEADVLIVNTCAFIDSAKEESIEAILEAHQQRGLRKKRRPEAHRQRLHGAAFFQGARRARCPRSMRSSASIKWPMRGKSSNESSLSRRQSKIQNPKSKMRSLTSTGNRSTSSPASRFTSPTTTRRASASRRRTPPYVKIAEGCNHPCSFCVIPQMRGKHRCRTIETVVAEVRALVAEGVKEINLISQDTTYFGMDLWEKKRRPAQPGGFIAAARR